MHTKDQIEIKTDKMQLPTVTNVVKRPEIHAKAMENTNTSKSASLASNNAIEPTILDQEPTKGRREIGLPQEILQNICSHSEPEDLSNLRLVTRGFRIAAAVVMFGTMEFSFERSSFERLKNVAKSEELRHYVLYLIYKGTTIPSQYMRYFEEFLPSHFSIRFELDETLSKFPNLGTFQLRMTYEYINQRQEVKNTRRFDPYWMFFASSLLNISELRSIKAFKEGREHTYIVTKSHPTMAITKKLIFNDEIALRSLHNLSLVLDRAFSLRLSDVTSCTSNLRSLELTDIHQFYNFSELMNPSIKFSSLVSLKLYGFAFNEQYFKEFLRTHANSLRSLSLRKSRIVITEEEYESETYIRSNQWIRLFYFLGEEMHLTDIELLGKFCTSLSGTWIAPTVSEGHDSYEPCSLMLRLKQFITHAEGSSFPLPHPDVDLTNVDLTKYCTKPGLFWQKRVEKRGKIRLLEREPHQKAIYVGDIEWSDDDIDEDFPVDTWSDDDFPVEDYWGLALSSDEEDSDGDLALDLSDIELDTEGPRAEEEEGLTPQQNLFDDQFDTEGPRAEEEEGLTPQQSPFDDLRNEILEARDELTDEERAELATLLDEY